MASTSKKRQKTRYPGIFRSKDGSIRLRATTTCPRSGRKHEATQTLPPPVTIEQARAALATLKVELLSQRATLRTTLRDFAVQWLERKAARVRPNVANQYADILARRILPQLGSRTLGALRRSDVEVWATWASAQLQPVGRPYARETVETWWRLLVQLLRDMAAELGLADPTARVRLPKPPTPPRRERQTLNPLQLLKFLDVAKAEAPGRLTELLVLAWTGMRAGELYGLDWDDVDFAGGVLHLRKSASHGYVTPTKTGSPREVPLPPELAQVLQAHRQQQVRVRHRGVRAGIVFASDLGGRHRPQSLHKLCRVPTKQASLPVAVGPQVLRRTFNTLMLRVGVDGVTLRSMMGHTTEAMTERYAGVPVEHKREALSRLLRRMDVPPLLGPNANGPDTNGPDLSVPAKPVSAKPAPVGQGSDPPIIRGGLRVIRGGRNE